LFATTKFFSLQNYTSLSPISFHFPNPNSLNFFPSYPANYGIPITQYEKERRAQMETYGENWDKIAWPHLEAY
jgi:hypothetical protein